MIPIENLLARAEVATGFPPYAITSPLRRAPVLRARYAVVLAAREEGYTLAAIGRALGHRDHATIRHAQTQAEALAEEDLDFSELVASLRGLIPLNPVRRPDPIPDPEPGIPRQSARLTYAEACRILDALAEAVRAKGMDPSKQPARDALWLVAWDKGVSTEQTATWAGRSTPIVRRANQLTREDYNSGTMPPRRAALIEDLGECV